MTLTSSSPLPLMPDVPRQSSHSTANVPSMTNTSIVAVAPAIALPLKGNENVTDGARIIDFLVQYGKIDEMTLNDTVIKMENVNNAITVIFMEFSFFLDGGGGHNANGSLLLKVMGFIQTAKILGVVEFTGNGKWAVGSLSECCWVQTQSLLPTERSITDPEIRWVRNVKVVFVFLLFFSLHKILAHIHSDFCWSCLLSIIIIVVAGLYWLNIFASSRTRVYATNASYSYR